MEERHKLEAALQTAECRRHGDLAGHYVITHNGDLIVTRPGQLRLAASVEQGIFVEGLKDGWRLATPADVEGKEREEAKRQAAEGRVAPAAEPPAPKAEAKHEPKAEKDKK